MYKTPYYYEPRGRSRGRGRNRYNYELEVNNLSERINQVNMNDEYKDQYEDHMSLYNVTAKNTEPVKGTFAGRQYRDGSMGGK